MQSGYGVPEIQQFMVDSCASLLSISHDMGSSPSNQQKHHPHHHHHHPHPQQQQQQQQRFHHLSPIPITQQFFHPFHPFQQQQQHQQHQQRRLYPQLGLDHESGPESGNSPSRIGLCQPHFVGTTNFKLGVDEENPMLRCEDGSDGRPLERWRNGEVESAIKEPFWYGKLKRGICFSRFSFSSPVLLVSALAKIFRSLSSRYRSDNPTFSSFSISSSGKLTNEKKAKHVALKRRR